MSKLSDAVKKYKAMATHPEKDVMHEILDALLEHLDGMASKKLEKAEKKE